MDKGCLPDNPAEESIRLRLQIAWHDHHHARDQSWKGLQIVAIVFAALIGLDISSDDGNVVVMIGGIATALLAFSGMAITIHHRNTTQVREFSFINKMQGYLGLHRSDLINPYEIYEPKKIGVGDMFSIDPRKNNTVVFMLRAYLVIALISEAVVVGQWLSLRGY